MNKKIIIGLVIVASVLLIMAIYGLLSTKNKKQTPTPTDNVLLSANLIQADAQFPALTPDQKIVYYQENGSMTGIYQIDLATKKNSLISTISEISGIDWSPNNENAILKVIYNSNKFSQEGHPFYLPNRTDYETTYWLYNLKTKKAEAIAKTVMDLFWKSDTEIIFYNEALTQNPSVASFNLLNMGDKKIKKLANAPAGIDLKILSVDDSFIYFNEMPSEGIGNFISRVDLKTNQIEPVNITDNTITNIKVSPQGDKLLLATTESENLKNIFYIYDLARGYLSNPLTTSDAVYGGWAQSAVFLITKQQILIIASDGSTKISKNIDFDILATSDFFFDAKNNSLYYLTNKNLYGFSLASKD